MATAINIADVTAGVTADVNGVVTGTGYLDDLMETVEIHLKAQFDQNRIVGDNYAKVYMGLFQSAMSQAMGFALNKRNKELSADALDQDVQKKVEDVAVAVATRADRIALSAAQTLKTQAEASYIDEQETQLIASVGFNNKIKALDALGDTYGTFGAGGITVSTDMWTTYYSIVNDLSTAAIPTSTTVSKVV